jgi:hypothetical protein
MALECTTEQLLVRRGRLAMTDGLKLKTIDECTKTRPELWAKHVEAYRERAREKHRLALIDGDAQHAEHWRLHGHVVELDPRDWDGYGFLDRWEGDFEGERGDCSSGCAHYRPLRGDLGFDWGVCTSPISHRKGKLTFEHQGCYAFEPGADPEWEHDDR